MAAPTRNTKKFGFSVSWGKQQKVCQDIEGFLIFISVSGFCGDPPRPALACVCIYNYILYIHTRDYTLFYI
jgi:hypothetical protein